MTPLIKWNAVKITGTETYRSRSRLWDRIRVGVWDKSEGGDVQVVEPLEASFQYALFVSPPTHRYNGSDL